MSTLFKERQKICKVNNKIYTISSIQKEKNNYKPCEEVESVTYN